MYDSIVIGLGGMGSAAAYHLARRGKRVLGLDQFGHVHDRGSSHGQSRIIRMAYFEHPDYVPLLKHAYTLWEDLAEESGDEIMNLCGMYMAGAPDCAVIAGTRRAAAEHGLPLETIATEDARVRFPGLHADGDMQVLYDPLGGYLMVERCVAAHLSLARRAGADLRENEAVRSWRADGGGVEVSTGTGTYRADSLVLCAGAWTGALSRELQFPLAAHRVVSAWFPSDSQYFEKRAGAPVFGIQTANGFFYGFPRLDGRGVKIALHRPGARLTDPSSVDRTVTEDDVRPLQEFAARYLNGIQTDAWTGSVCIYTMTPDENFILDRHPHNPSVYIATGFSGHGFKFSAVVGSILADFCADGHTSMPINFLNARRFPTIGEAAPVDT